MSKRYIKAHLVKVAPRTHLILDVKCCYSQSELDSRKQTLHTQNAHEPRAHVPII